VKPDSEVNLNRHRKAAAGTLPASVVKAKDENISLKNGKKLAKP